MAVKVWPTPSAVSSAPWPEQSQPTEPYHDVKWVQPCSFCKRRSRFRLISTTSVFPSDFYPLEGQKSRMRRIRAACFSNIIRRATTACERLWVMEFSEKYCRTSGSSTKAKEPSCADGSHNPSLEAPAWLRPKPPTRSRASRRASRVCGAGKAPAQERRADITSPPVVMFEAEHSAVYSSVAVDRCRATALWRTNSSRPNDGKPAVASYRSLSRHRQPRICFSNFNGRHSSSLSWKATHSPRSP